MDHNHKEGGFVGAVILKRSKGKSDMGFRMIVTSDGESRGMDGEKECLGRRSRFLARS